jgi:hypothetical protein
LKASNPSHQGEDSDEATYEAARKLFGAAEYCRVYNVAGGNRGLRLASYNAYRPVYHPN